MYFLFCPGCLIQLCHYLRAHHSRQTALVCQCSVTAGTLSLVSARRMPFITRYNTVATSVALRQEVPDKSLKDIPWLQPPPVSPSAQQAPP